MNRLKNGAQARMWSLSLLLITFVAGCGSSSQDAGVADTTPPTVSSPASLNAAVAVAPNANVTSTFSEPMDAATINTTSFILQQGDSVIPGTVTYIGTTATFDPTSDLEVGTDYTATITTGAKDLAGNALTNQYTWTFTTGTAADTVAPTVSATAPLDMASAVALNTNLTATFSEALDAATINATSFTLHQGSSVIAGVVTYTGTAATFDPDTDLLANTDYTATITTDARDLADNALANQYVWRFSSGTIVDATAPTVTAAIPMDMATGIARSADVSATFSKAMDAATISATTFTLYQGTTAVPSVVTYSGTTATLNPASDLAANTDYVATLTTAAKDLAGNALVSDYVWRFTTATAALAPVSLGTAGNYLLLAKTSIATAPNALMNGNVGLSPATRAGLIGWSETSDATDTYSTSTRVLAPFKIYAADYAGGSTAADLVIAINNMQSAYADAAGRVVTSVANNNVGAGTLTDLTLAAGVYAWDGAVNIPTDLRLNGNASDVWIFKVAGTLDMAVAKRIIISGGASPYNVFWQVADAVTVGANTHFEGNILGKTSITFGNFSSINGRLLAQTAIVLE